MQLLCCKPNINLRNYAPPRGGGGGGGEGVEMIFMHYQVSPYATILVCSENCFDSAAIQTLNREKRDLLSIH